MFFKKKKNNSPSTSEAPVSTYAVMGPDLTPAEPIDAESIDLSFSSADITSADKDKDRQDLFNITDAVFDEINPDILDEIISFTESFEPISDFTDIDNVTSSESISVTEADTGNQYSEITVEDVIDDGQSENADSSNEDCSDPLDTDLHDIPEAETEVDNTDDPKEEASEYEEDEKDEEPLNDFEASLRDFSEEDADPLVKSSSKGFDVVRGVIFAICVIVCIDSTSSLIRNIYDKFRGEQIYGDIINSVADGFNLDGNVDNSGGKLDLLGADDALPYTPTMGDIVKNGITEVATPSDHSEELARMRASLESLRNINKDIFGWIKIPGTNINYPIAQTDNNEYYLDHAYTGEDLVNGSIYADYRCNDVITDNYNTILYGHNITTGSMFNHVTKFFDEEFFNSTLIYLYTFDGIYVYKPFSIHEAAFDSGYVDVGFQPEEFVKFAMDLASLSDIPSDVSFVPEDTILTLSTCTNGIASKRYALHAKLTEAITD